MTDKMFDLSTLDAMQERQNEGVEFPIMDAARQDTGIRIKVAGPDSDTQRKARDAVMQRMINAGNDVRTLEDRQRDNIAILAAAVLDWTGIHRKGEPVECNRDEVVSLLTRYPVVRDQIDIYASTRALYMPIEGEDSGK
ncbi:MULTISPECIES: hypothetical protein [unclassified Mesorhizobium]|uniref:hypothetical protein n=1 Tax=unclassified Mesorhizobium TaxID=325217 RepID=UPI00112C709D|nr:MULTISPECIES: hypothetical protein [unclassified Mesorhizobium]TPK42636.1 hypothetical protein FJ550_29720 [Mesorhizobium sp. B2-5-2]TPL26756.1 hypothetical protein FJ946_13040 [Mesorhizobium sp. B2-4-7]TPL40534.1 hypothetical protein FJ961_17340 [Mesorhizobium sp. B2-4-5]TPM76808.1 hypothetical protein FJ968_03570 [Mesorhizobium sp. B2-1-6]TPN72471.1 hypothetical protein FJ985_29225 [Mesorhizobium sp. B1-1-2]